MDFVLCHILLLLHPCSGRKVPADASLNTSVITDVADLVCNFFVQIDETGLTKDVSSVPNAILSLVAFLPLLVSICQSSDLSRDRHSRMLKGVLAIYRGSHPLSSNRQLLVKCFSEQLKVTFEQHQDSTKLVDIKSTVNVEISQLLLCS